MAFENIVIQQQIPKRRSIDLIIKFLENPMTEKEKMLDGMIYDPSDDELQKLRTSAHNLCCDYNNLYETDEKRKEIIDKLIPQNNGVYLQGPIFFDYGAFTTFGKRCFANFNFTVLDCAPVTIGDNVFFGPNVSIYTPMHPFLAEERNMYFDGDKLTDKEYAKPITICSDCWIAGNVTICGGVTVNKGCVIGAGSVVTSDIPENSLAAGVPCRVIRKITKDDSIYLKKQLFPKNNK